MTRMTGRPAASDSWGMATTDDVTCALCGEPVARWRMMVGVSLCDHCAGAIRDHFAKQDDVDFGEGWGDD